VGAVFNQLILFYVLGAALAVVGLLLIYLSHIPVHRQLMMLFCLCYAVFIVAVLLKVLSELKLNPFI
jgi:hypothetical protein